MNDSLYDQGATSEADAPLIAARASTYDGASLTVNPHNASLTPVTTSVEGVPQLGPEINPQSVNAYRVLNGVPVDESEPSRESLTSSTDSDFDDPHKKRVNASVLASIMNLTNTILGAGTLGLPFAMSKSGVEVGICLFVMFGCLSGVGLQLMCHAAKEVPHSDFTKLSKQTIPWATILVDLAVCIKCFGVGTSYFIVAGDLIPEVVDYFLDNNADHQHIWKNRRIWISIFVAMFTLPIVHWRNLKPLRYVAGFCLTFMFIVMLTVMFYGFWQDEFDPCDGLDPGEQCKGIVNSGPGNALDFMGVLPIFIFGFTCHQNAFAITNEIKNPTHWRLDMVVYGSMVICVVVYSIVSFAGYHTFGSLVPQDILSQYPEEILTTIVRLILSINLSLSYPLQLNPCRNSLSQLLFRKRALELPKHRFLILTYSITLASWAVSLIVDSLGAVLAIVGATGSTTISYILPGIFYYYTFANEPDNKLKYVALAMVVLGCCVVPFALTMVFVSGEASG